MNGWSIAEVSVVSGHKTWGELKRYTRIQPTDLVKKINKEATHSMAFVEPSVSLPLIYGYVFQKGLYKGRPRMDFEWEGDTLKKIARCK